MYCNYLENRCDIFLENIAKKKPMPPPQLQAPQPLASKSRVGIEGINFKESKTDGLLRVKKIWRNLKKKTFF